MVIYSVHTIRMNAFFTIPTIVTILLKKHIKNESTGYYGTSDAYFFTIPTIVNP